MQEQVDVCVVGGGVVGLSVALKLAEAGKTVRLVDKDYIGHAHFNIGDVSSQSSDAKLQDLLRHSLTKWQEMAERPEAQELEIKQRGTAMFAMDDRGFHHLASHVAVLRQRQVPVEFHKASELNGKFGDVAVGEAVQAISVLSEEMVIQTIAALNGLRQMFVRAGGRIWGSDRVGEFIVQDGRVCGVKTDSGDICQADKTIVCAGVKASKLLQTLDIRVPLRPARGHLMELTPGHNIPEPVVALRTGEGTIRLKQDDTGRVLVSYDGLMDQAQATYAKEPDYDCVRKVLAVVGQIYPVLQQAVVEAVHTVTIAVTPDARPCIGQYGDKEGLLLAVGLNGRSFAMAAGVADVMHLWLDGKESPVDMAVFAPDRFIKGAWKPVENAEHEVEPPVEEAEEQAAEPERETPEEAAPEQAEEEEEVADQQADESAQSEVPEEESELPKPVENDENQADKNQQVLVNEKL